MDSDRDDPPDVLIYIMIGLLCALGASGHVYAFLSQLGLIGG